MANLRAQVDVAEHRDGLPDQRKAPRQRQRPGRGLVLPVAEAAEEVLGAAELHVQEEVGRRVVDAVEEGQVGVPPLLRVQQLHDFQLASQSLQVPALLDACLAHHLHHRLRLLLLRVGTRKGLVHRPVGPVPQLRPDVVPRDVLELPRLQASVHGWYHRCQPAPEVLPEDYVDALLQVVREPSSRVTPVHELGSAVSQVLHLQHSTPDAQSKAEANRLPGDDAVDAEVAEVVVGLVEHSLLRIHVAVTEVYLGRDGVGHPDHGGEVLGHSVQRDYEPAQGRDLILFHGASENDDRP
mmetsp:Transcript_115673/g.291033  ORF Transcript_115673/g.291033 Transcript_115673/m.291033 type:complete len:296 (+) Transcript_115673:601-1488(+)